MRLLLTLIAAMVAFSASAQEQKPEWQDPKITSLGKETPRAYFMSYSTRESAAKNNFLESEFCISLNKNWKFAYYEDSRDRANQFYLPSYDTGWWEDIAVPSNMERKGFGKPLNAVGGFEFQPSNPRPPMLPEATPVGLYRTQFTLPLSWLDRDIFLHIGGAKSGVYVYVNGQKVGYSEDSKSAAEFNINKYVTDGRNIIALEIYRWSTGSYLESQDLWRMSGIERDIYIYTQPKYRIEDFYVTQSLDTENYADGIFKLDMCMVNSFTRPSGMMQVWYELEDATGTIIDYSYREINLEPNSRDTVRFEKVYKNVRRWSAEDPYLYKLIMKVKREGLFTEYVSQQIGFRTSEVRDGHYLVNGKKVTIKGVNLYETHPVSGHVVDEESLKKDMEMMKKLNINAIRTAHYPHQRIFYELADKYGFYVFSEANIQSDGMGYDRTRRPILSNNPNWLGAFIDRTRNMYHQTKNYPSIVVWSLGNNAGNGYNFFKTYEWLKAADQTRPVVYAQAGSDWNSDMLFSQNSVTAQDSKAAPRPLILAEFGQNTSMEQTWEAASRSQGFQGGFIWNWSDQGMLEYHKTTGKAYWSYGSYDDKTLNEQETAACRGIVTSDRILGQEAQMAKNIYKSLTFSTVDAATGKFKVKNNYSFTATDKFTIKYYIKANGKNVSEGVVATVVKPGAEAVITIPLAKVKKTPKAEYSVVIEASLKVDDGILKKGHVATSESFKF